MSRAGANERGTIATLAPDLWFGRLWTLAGRLETGQTGLEEALRHAFHLVQIAPGPFSEIVECELSEVAYESYLGKGAFDAAATALTSSAYLEISVEVPDGYFVVVVRSDLFDVNARVAGQHREETLLRSWIEALLAIEDAAKAEGFNRPYQDPRRPQSGQHRRSIQH